MEELKQISRQTLKTVEQEATMLDDLSRTLGGIESDVKALKESQELLISKVNNMEARLTKAEFHDGVISKAGGAIWTIIVSFVSAVIAYFIGKN